MKNISIVLGTALTSLMLGCASPPVALTTMGPNPNGPKSAASTGELQVFTYMAERSDNQNQGSTDPIWYQHTDYGIYALNGRLVRQVGNTTGHYAESPRLVALPAGHYIVKAHAVGDMFVKAPVTIKSGQVTRLHLDEKWNPPVGIVTSELVKLPDGKPIGWRNDADQ
jgi:hypothetical protein